MSAIVRPTTSTFLARALDARDSSVSTTPSAKHLRRRRTSIVIIALLFSWGPRIVRQRRPTLACGLQASCQQSTQRARASFALDGAVATARIIETPDK